MRTDLNTNLSLQRLLISNSERVPLHVNPHAGTAESEVAAWARSKALYLPRMNLVLSMASFLYPTASLERLIVIGKIMFLLFYIDDVYGDLLSSQGLQRTDGDVWEHIKGCCQTFSSGYASLTTTPLEQAFFQVRKEMDDCAPSEWIERFSRSLADHLTCSVMPTLYGWNARSQSIPSYLAVREQISGMYPTIDFIEFANEAFLTARAVSQPIISKLRVSCARIACLTNDLFSYYKEVVHQGLLLNLIQVIQTTELCSLPDAIERSIQLINTITEEFFHYSQVAREYLWNADPNFDAQASAAIKSYLIGLEYQISATWHWQISTNRYRAGGSPFIDLKTPVQ